MKLNTLKTAVLAFGMVLFFSSNAFAQSEDKGGRKERATFAQLLEKMDANEDGKLAKDEVNGRLQKQFDTLDTDNDGFLSSEEYKEAPKRKMQERKQSESQERGGRPNFAKLLEQMDTNEDGKLAKDEVKGRLAKRFDTVDANEDGFISEEEFNNAPKPKRRGRKK